jgi:hypothetical protein
MAKSPVYGRGRNRKHRGGKGYGPFHAAAANINMRGKKTKPDHCWCCVCIDMREDIQAKEHRKEIREYMQCNGNI